MPSGLVVGACARNCFMPGTGKGGIAFGVHDVDGAEVESVGLDRIPVRGRLLPRAAVEHVALDDGAVGGCAAAGL